ncbi:MAG: EAL domain-containing protein, partial [Prochloraceae cyanobacterium]
ILDSMIDSLIVIDLEGKIQKVNQATLQLLGYQEQELINKSIQLILPDKSLAFQPNNFNFSYFLGSCETTYLTKEEKIIPVAFSSSYILNDEQEPQGIVCVAKDITEKQLAEKALRESEERYALASRAANDGLWDWNLLSQQIYFSPRWKYLLGYQDSEIGSCVEEWFSRVHPDYLDRLDRAINDHLNNKTSHLEISYPMLHRDGSYRWILCRAITVRDERGKAYRIAGSQTDITQSWLAEEQLRYEAKHDKLTQLPNRTSFHEELEKLIQLTKEDEDYLFAVLFLDLDGFKLINDSLGHQAGDQLLIAIGNKAEACLREGDFIARLGGDEFAILLKQIKDVSDATAIADRIQQELAKPLNLDGHEVLVSASIGIALSQQGYDNFKDFLRDADIAMYQAKARGKARHIVFESDMHLEALKRLQLEQELRRAIEQKQFDVFYQPIIALESGKINGFEVLIRWQHPEKGLVCPAEFIPVAEETGMIASIDWWVLRTACHQIRQWQAQHKIHYPLTISVNISAIQFLISDFTAQILQILEETELEPKYLKLEITESAIIKNLDHASLILEKLKAIGIRISMDDFGTGYSCLSYLYELPIDTLKIDVFFLRDIEKDREKLEVTRTIVNLANNLGMDVIAEGVETSNQLVLLRELNCEYGQGYLFAKPLANQRAEALISSLRY